MALFPSRNLPRCMIFANFWVLQVLHFMSREIARPILSLVSRETRDHLPTLVNNEYDDPELQENLPEKPILEKIYRNILASDPRVKKFKIVWDSPNIIQTADDEDNYLCINES